MVRILFFGRFSDLSGEMNVDLPDNVSDVVALREWLSSKIEGFDTLAAQPGTHIAVNKSIVMGAAEISDDDEIAFMSALSGG